MSFRDFVDAYIDCALWSSSDDSGEPLDQNYSPDDIHPDSLRDIEAVCRDFYDAWSEVWQGAHRPTQWNDDQIAGYDFWLTRNRHGAGFWDGDWSTVGYDLTTACKPYGGAYIYVGDDGMLHGGA
jgi:hypothetical protein